MERNYRYQKNEIDIISFEAHEDYEKGGQIVFVEVKYRSGDQFGSPEESLSEDQKKRIWKASEAYLYETKLEGSPCRFDVIAIDGKGGSAKIKHFKDAFWFFGGRVMG